MKLSTTKNLPNLQGAIQRRGLDNFEYGTFRKVIANLHINEYKIQKLTKGKINYRNKI